jgi:predicted amino acid-binding ACT domain protein
MDGTFVMNMLVDISDCDSGPAGLRRDLDHLGQTMGLTVMVHSESVVKAMHRV